jgi:UDP-sulfoquinovose synthase
MKICILGGEGYLGWPTSLYFSARGDQVLIIDSLAKRRWERECGVRPLRAIPPLAERVALWQGTKRWQREISPITFELCDIAGNGERLREILRRFRPDTIIHYAEQPSAPYSMASGERAGETQRNNVIGTLNVIFAMRDACPDAQLVKLGTMGEYGTPNIDIEEGWLDIEHNGRRDRMLFPKQPGSFYHLSKVHDSANLEFACRIWGLRVTDLNQGVVYGMATDATEGGEGLHTSFHYDAVFGTVLNRFIVQTVLGVPLTVYGNGSQTRGFLNIRDTLRCVELAALNPAQPGEFRVFNQFTEQFSMLQLAEAVAVAGRALGYPVAISHIENPRVEAEDHYYNAKHQGLQHLGLEAHLLDDAVLIAMIEAVAASKDQIDPSAVLPSIYWRDPEAGDANVLAA